MAAFGTGGSRSPPHGSPSRRKTLPSHTLSITPKSVRDLAIPLGGFINVVATHTPPQLPGHAGALRRSARVRSMPPVCLPRHGEVALPRAGCRREFACEHSDLLPLLSEQPLLIELWHHDKYTQDVLLGVASVDLAEVLSTRPHSKAGAYALHRHELTVPCLAPAEGLLPGRLAKGALPCTLAGSHHVALIDVVLGLEIGMAAPPPAAASSSSPTAAPTAATAAEALTPPRPTASLRAAPAAARCSPWRGGGRVAAAPATPASSRARSELESWKAREHARWKAALRQKEEERLSMLAREWKVHESRRAVESREQSKAMAAVTRELKHKLAQLVQQENALGIAEAELMLRGQEMAEQGQREKGELVAAAERERCRVLAELHAAQAKLAEAEARVDAQQRRAEQLTETEAKAQTQATVWKEAHAGAAAKAMALESDKGHLAATLEIERNRLAQLAAEQQAAESLSVRRREADAAAAAKLQATAVRQAEQHAAAELAESSRFDEQLEKEMGLMRERLRKHADKVRDEAAELLEVRTALAERARAPKGEKPRGGATDETASSLARKAMTGRGGGRGGRGGGRGKENASSSAARAGADRPASASATLSGHGAGVGSSPSKTYAGIISPRSRAGIASRRGGLMTAGAFQ